MKPILVPYGADEPLLLEPGRHAEAIDLAGPEGSTGDDAAALAAAALERPDGVPPLERHVVPGDRVAVAVSGSVPCPSAVVAAVRERLEHAGIAPADTIVLRAPAIAGLDDGDPADGGEPRDDEPGAIPGQRRFDPGHESETAYIAADAEGSPLHVARMLVDADVVVAVGGFAWDAALGGPALEGELWPAFARTTSRRDVVRRLARGGRLALGDLRERAREIGWHLGTMANVRVVPGRGNSLHAAVFGTPASAAEAAAALARGWRPSVDGSADLAVATLADPSAGWATVVRAVAAAARVVRPDGTICLACRSAAPPGPVLLRWRQGAPLPALVKEALASGDETLVENAVQTRFLAKALGRRRLVLLSALDGETVEELEFGHADGPDAVERLAARAERLVVLRDAERMLPRRRR